MAEIKHRVGIKGSTGQIYSLLTTDKGLARWWTSDTQGVGEVGSIIHFHFAATEVKFEVIELIPQRLVRWRHSGNMPPGWVPRLFFNWNSRINKLYFYLVTMTGKIRMTFWHIAVPSGVCS